MIDWLCKGKRAHTLRGQYSVFKAYGQEDLAIRVRCTFLRGAQYGGHGTRKGCHYYTTLGALIVYSSDRACPCHAKKCNAPSLIFRACISPRNMLLFLKYLYWRFSKHHVSHHQGVVQLSVPEPKLNAVTTRDHAISACHLFVPQSSHL
jgi:hypothetical protein